MHSKALKSRTKNIGLPAGSIKQSETSPTIKSSISVITYTPSYYEKKTGESLQSCLSPPIPLSITWINVCGIEDSRVIEQIGKHFGLHPLVLEDIMSVGQRSKLDDYKDTLYMIVKMLTYNSTKQVAEDEQISLILGDRFVISFMEKEDNIFRPIYDRLLQPNSRIRQRGADYLCYSLIDSLVDNYFLILEKVDGKLDRLEYDLFKHQKVNTMQHIHHAKREISQLRKSVWPMREVIGHFRRIETPLILDATKLYVQDVYDHTIQAIDTIESFRDITSGMLDIYLSNLSQRMNEVMKVLTVVATIFVPLTFIASIYGMNFEIPELHWKYGYPAVLGLMLLISLSMLAFFRRKKWI